MKNHAGQIRRSPCGRDGGILLLKAFDPIAVSYDQWYDSREGRIIFGAELGCFRQLCGSCLGRWLEVGVGTGRFASSLGIGEGIDPSPRMLEIESKRGIRSYGRRAEALPFPDDAFDGILLAAHSASSGIRSRPCGNITGS